MSLRLLRRIPYPPLVVAALFLGLAPFIPEPHLAQKLRLLARGELTRPLDVFDLFFHLFPLALLLARYLAGRGTPRP